MALALLDREPAEWARPLVTFGRVPLFFYLLQWYVIHGLALLVAILRGQSTGWLFSSTSPPVAPPECSYSLPIVYLLWLLVLILLYPACRWFANLKQRRRSPWPSYF